MIKKLLIKNSKPIVSKQSDQSSKSTQFTQLDLVQTPLSYISSCANSLSSTFMLTLLGLTLTACGGGGGGGSDNNNPTHQAPKLTTDRPGPAVISEDGKEVVYRVPEDFPIKVTATKRDSLGNETTGIFVSFPLQLTSTSDNRDRGDDTKRECTANLNTAGATNASDGNGNAIWKYPENRVGSNVTVTYEVEEREETLCGDFTFRATEDGKKGEVTYSGLRFLANVNLKPSVRTVPSGPAGVDKGKNFKIEVIVTKRDNKGVNSVTFPTRVVTDPGTGESCTAGLLKEGGLFKEDGNIEEEIEEDSNPIRSYPENKAGSNITLIYAVRGIGRDSTICGDFTFRATEDGETGEATYRGLIFDTGAPPLVTIATDHTGAVLDRAIDVFTINITAVKQDIRGSEVSFPLEVESTLGTGTAGGVCTAVLSQEDGTPDTNPVKTYPANDSGLIGPGSNVTVTYRVGAPGNALTRCGTFMFNATEDGLTNEDSPSTTYAGGLIFDSHRAAEVTTNPDTPMGIDSSDSSIMFTINVTATKQDSLPATSVGFRRVVPSDTGGCSAILAGLSTRDYPVNSEGFASLGSNVTVTYGVTPVRSGAFIECGTFNFTAKEDGDAVDLTGFATYSGLIFVSGNQAPRITTNQPAPVTLDIDATFAIKVTARKQDISSSNTVIFPNRVVSTSADGTSQCTAMLETAGSTDTNATHSTWTYEGSSFNSPATVTYRGINPNSGSNTLCGDFTFTATEDGKTGEATYSDLVFGSIRPPILTTDPSAPVTLDIIDDDFTIEVTATKQDALGNRVVFPLNVAATSGISACTAELVEEGGTQVGENYVIPYSNTSEGSNVTVTYSVDNPRVDRFCGNFKFTATIASRITSVVYSGLLFSDGYVDDDDDGLVDIRNAVELDGIRNHINNLDGEIVSPLDESICPMNDENQPECIGYELLNDIDLSGYPAWEPIGDSTVDEDHLHGIFEGNGNVIYNLNIDIREARTDATSIAGLFGAFDGEIRNLHLRDVSISAPNIANVGALVGVYMGSGGSISNSTAIGDSINGDDSSSSSVGGLIGRAEANLSMNNVSVDFINIDGGIVGGLLAAIGSRSDRTSSNLEIVNSEAVINQIDAREDAGGLVGIFHSTGAFEIVNSNVDIGQIVTGDNQVAERANAGGIAGFVSSDSTIRIGRPTALVNSITSRANAGGIVGSLSEGSSQVDIYAASVVANSIQGRRSAGGVAGYIVRNSGSPSIYSSTVIANNIQGTGTGQSEGAGGLIGRFEGSSTLGVRSSSAIVDAIGHLRSNSPSSSGGLIYALGAVDLSHSFAANREIKVFAVDSWNDELIAPNSISVTNINIADSYWQEGVIIDGGTGSANVGGTGQDLFNQIPSISNSLYNNWGGANAGWCNPTTGEYTQDDGQPAGYVAAWDLMDSSYSASHFITLNCLSITSAEQISAHSQVRNQQSPLSEFTRRFRSQ